MSARVSGNTFALSGDVWLISYDGDEIQLSDSKGLGDLATLLRQPGVEVAALDLMDAGVVTGDSGPTSDAAARKQYEARVRELQSDIDDAEAMGDSHRAERARAELDALVDLFNSMLADSLQTRPDVVVMEIADGVLQRETQMLLENAHIRRHVRGVVLAAPCASSALFGLEQIRQYGLTTIAVSGIISNSPLFMKEFSGRSKVPVASSAGDACELASLVVDHCELATT